MHAIGLIDEAAAVLQAGKGVGEAYRNIDDVVICDTEFDTSAMSIRRAVFANVHHDIENTPTDAVDQFCVGMGMLLEVEATDHISGGGGEELFFQLQGNPVFSELSFVERLDEIAARIAMDERLEDFDAGEGFGD